MGVFEGLVLGSKDNVGFSDGNEEGTPVMQ